MTVHAMEEMAEDDLDILDIEEAVLNGRVVRSNRREPLGPKHTVEGLALDGEKLIGVVGRFSSTARFLIITVYEIHEAH
jgi:uncharacterized protein DUF4258